jgi:glycerate-2-kinase
MFLLHPNSFDILIIGGGAVGCAVARELSRYDVSIALLEKEADVASGASGRNSAVVHAGFNNKPGSLMAKLCVEGSKGFEAACRELGYEPVILTDWLCCTARDAGVFLGNIARYHAQSGKPMAFLAGGETVVHLTGKGKGGRNQELALAAAEGISGLDAAVFSLGSDGTDGPTDAAGGYVDGTSFETLRTQGIVISDVLQNNDAYHALEKCGGLIITGPTGTNVNDLSVLLIR